MKAIACIKKIILIIWICRTTLELTKINLKNFDWIYGKKVFLRPITNAYDMLIKKKKLV